MKKIENEIRDKLANNLNIFPKNLRYLDKESFLPNNEGTRGFIDLLATDNHNRYVIIELKRSKASSREAIHEVLKYIEGIKKSKGLKNDEITAYVVSTEWSELIVPFSRFAAESAYSVQGFELKIDDQCNPISVELVQPLELKNERYLSDEHEIRLYSNRTSLQKGINSHISCYLKKGINNYVLLVLSSHSDFRKYEILACRALLNNSADYFEFEHSYTYEGINESIPEYKFMVYSSVNVLSREEYLQIIKKNPSYYENIKDEIESMSTEELDYNLHGYVLGCDPVPFHEHYESSYPSNLGNKILKLEGWKIEDIIRGGSFKENVLLSDKTIIEELTGSTGSNKQYYSKTLNSEIKSVFNQILKETEICLENNLTWKLGVKKAIEESLLLSKEKEFDGKIEILNPCNILLSIYRIDKAANECEARIYTPSYYLTLKGDDVQKVYFGGLTDNNKTFSLQEVLNQAYGGDEKKFLFSIFYPEGSQLNDIDCDCSIYGLEYSNYKCDTINSEQKYFKYDGFRYKECSPINPFESIISFINRNRKFVTDLVKLIDLHSINPGQIVI